MSIRNRLTREYASIDIETTGLEHEGHEIVQIGIVLAKVYWNGEKWCWEEGQNFTSLIRPIMTNNIDPEAMKINGLSKAELSSAPRPHTVRADLNEWWLDITDKKKIILGQNFGGFDKPFLQKFLGRFYDSMFDYHAVDTWSEAEMCQTLGLLPPDLRLNLESISEHFNDIRLTHSALADAKAALDVRVNLLNLIEGATNGMENLS
jgi:DNA polymerase III epsilon subunit-like protein